MSSQYHFADAGKMVGSAPGSSQEIDNLMLTCNTNTNRRHAELVSASPNSHTNINHRHAELVSASLTHPALLNPEPLSCHTRLDPASRATAQTSLLNAKGREGYGA
ncbi:hypothetical protein KIH87_18215 [Paraneptunicella aestuarii]|uniref:hypothetical protein n=1 Tax=Paraneptunicella aestuarii TaxID=2831148 RepID=UPI001E3AA22B|nr:hypothetical protein [Paraneptunicella aestuarii]UAA38576.1 hypothetical protein KIH87_18215 [Paraneptunicella aestuarii]